MPIDHETLLSMLTRLKLTAIRDQLDTLLDEAAGRELNLREALGFLCEREVARQRGSSSSCRPWSSFPCRLTRPNHRPLM
jgi:hypothetical protein